MASNILKSSGSPASSPSITVSEWHVAMAHMMGRLPSDDTCLHTGSKCASGDVGTAPHMSRPSSVRVPVCQKIKIKFNLLSLMSLNKFTGKLRMDLTMKKSFKFSSLIECVEFIFIKYTHLIQRSI